MHRRLRALVALLVGMPLVLALTPASAAPTAVEFAFDAPPGWAEAKRTDHLVEYVIGQGMLEHFIFVTADPQEQDVQKAVEAIMGQQGQTVQDAADEGSTTTCDGQPAHRLRYTLHSGELIATVHVLLTKVTGGVGSVAYTHPADLADRPDALAAMASLCPAPFAFPTIPGWTAPSESVVGLLVLSSHDGSGSFSGSYRRLAHDRFPSVYQDDPTATVVRTWSPTCANGELRRRTLSRGDATVEVAQGYLRGYSYAFAYAHTSPTPDPAAMHALTSICAPTGGS
jgi:hypothetical protein